MKYLRTNFAIQLLSGEPAATFLHFPQEPGKPQFFKGCFRGTLQLLFRYFPSLTALLTLVRYLFINLRRGKTLARMVICVGDVRRGEIVV